MTGTTLQQKWEKLQRNRIHKIRRWYGEHYRNAYLEDAFVRYIVLWSVFNALYNSYDLPNNEIPEKINGRFKFKIRFGHKVPIIRVTGDSDRITGFADILASMDDFVNLINQPEVRKQIIYFVHRIPSVARREAIHGQPQIPIIMRDENLGWIVEEEFSPGMIHGVASLDHRLFLADGYKFFEYAAIDNPWDSQGVLIDPKKTIEQLIHVLYQLRNNIVHGGVVTNKRKDIINDALPILNEIVEFVFMNSGRIYMGEKRLKGI